MIFTEWELERICNSLEKDMGRGNGVYNAMIIDKLNELRKTSVNKRYTLRTTDWLSEAAKKQRGRKKSDNAVKRDLL